MTSGSAKVQIDVLWQEWSRKHNPKALLGSFVYFAHCRTLECESRGTVTMTIEDVMLRIFVLTALENKKLRELEIGTLFEIGLQ